MNSLLIHKIQAYVIKEFIFLCFIFVINVLDSLKLGEEDGGKKSYIY